MIITDAVFVYMCNDSVDKLSAPEAQFPFSYQKKTSKNNKIIVVWGRNHRFDYCNPIG